MNMHNVIVVGLLAVLLVAGCSQQSIAPGILQGKVSIGPICPVQRNPPDPSCQPTAETYKAYPITVYSAGKKMTVSQLPVNGDGTFSMELSPGNYVLDRQQGGVGGSNLPQEFIIKSGQTTTLEISVDTGIR
jgi:hypothetical protein